MTSINKKRNADQVIIENLKTRSRVLESFIGTLIQRHGNADMDDIVYDTSFAVVADQKFPYVIDGKGQHVDGGDFYDYVMSFVCDLLTEVEDFGIVMTTTGDTGDTVDKVLESMPFNTMVFTDSLFRITLKKVFIQIMYPKVDLKTTFYNIIDIDSSFPHRPKNPGESIDDLWDLVSFTLVNNKGTIMVMHNNKSFDNVEEKICVRVKSLVETVINKGLVVDLPKKNDSTCHKRYRSKYRYRVHTR